MGLDQTLPNITHKLTAVIEMVRVLHSPSPTFSDSPGILSSSSSSSDAEDLAPPNSGRRLGVSSPAVPSSAHTKEPPEPADTVTCLWEDCGDIFSHLPTLIEHIHSTHIGVHKSNYTCEWATCSRRGLSQTSRFALISHIRSHTGEKPFTCARPECDKSFTRSDALAKHMRLQHNMPPPPSGRGSSRKRKRGDSPVTSSTAPTSFAPVSVPGPASANIAIDPPSGFNTFKVEPRSPSDTGAPHGDYFDGVSHDDEKREDGGAGTAMNDDDDEDGGLPAHLARLADPQTGLIMGRSPALVRYVIQKAKLRYALEMHAALIEELQVTRTQAHEERLRKEAMLDDLLKAVFGNEAAEPYLLPAPSSPVHPHVHGDGQQPSTHYSHPSNSYPSAYVPPTRT